MIHHFGQMTFQMRGTGPPGPYFLLQLVRFHVLPCIIHLIKQRCLMKPQSVAQTTKQIWRKFDVNQFRHVDILFVFNKIYKLLITVTGTKLYSFMICHYRYLFLTLLEKSSNLSGHTWLRYIIDIAIKRKHIGLLDYHNCSCVGLRNLALFVYLDFLGRLRFFYSLYTNDI